MIALESRLRGRISGLDAAYPVGLNQLEIATNFSSLLNIK